MLIMRRRVGESVLIGDDIEIHIVEVGRSRVKIAIDAPKTIAVVAKEVHLTSETNRISAHVPASDLSALVAQFRRIEDTSVDSGKKNSNARQSAR